MIAFHGEESIKAKFLSRVEQHRIADEIVKGYYWEKGKGCAVGCTVHAEHDAHGEFERQLGIPQILARLEDRIFENLPNEVAKEFPAKFLAAIPVGADLSRVWYQFALWLLVDEAEGVIRFAKTDKTKSAIRTVAELYGRAARGEEVARSEWLSARKVAAAAYAAADAADAAYAAYAAADAAAADAAYAAAAYAAAYAADADADAYAADADAYAADADAYAADADAYAADAWRTAKQKAFVRQSEKLLELLRAAPVAKEVIAA